MEYSQQKVGFPRPLQFFSELSDNTGAKLLLVGLMFIFLVLPTAIAIAAGMPGVPALLIMAVLVLPFMYGVYGLLSLVFEKSKITDRPIPQSIYEVARQETLIFSSASELQRVLWVRRLVWTWSLFPLFMFLASERDSRQAEVVETFSSPTFSRDDELTNLSPISELSYVRR